MESEDSSDERNSNAAKRKHAKRKKVPTYYRRKEEMDRLEEERKQLELQVQELAKRADVLRPREALQRRQQTNKMLREMLHAQRRVFAGASSIMSHHFREKSAGPFDTPTKLSKDPVKRKLALMEMRAQRLSCAYEFMMEMHSDKDGKPLIVFSRWWSLRLRKSHIHVPKFVAERIRNGLESVSASMLAAAERADIGQ
ncbi:hypothetical protein KRP22_007344 [Phytophthora ramorum]|nr:hypothetical protein KRP22_4645 [Phytophthora ramorum]